MQITRSARRRRRAEVDAAARTRADFRSKLFLVHPDHGGSHEAACSLLEQRRPNPRPREAAAMPVTGGQHAITVWVLSVLEHGPNTSPSLGLGWQLVQLAAGATIPIKKAGDDIRRTLIRLERLRRVVLSVRYEKNLSGRHARILGVRLSEAAA